MTEFAAYLDDKLSQAGLSQDQFAAHIGRSPQYLSDMKHGKRPITDAVTEGLVSIGCARDEAYWLAGRIPPDIESLVFEMGPERWREWRASYYGGPQ